MIPTQISGTWRAEMEERKYVVNVGNDRIACDMTLDDALLLIRAYFDKYDKECGMAMTVKEMQRVMEG